MDGVRTTKMLAEGTEMGWGSSSYSDILMLRAVRLMTGCDDSPSKSFCISISTFKSKSAMVFCVCCIPGHDFGLGL